MGVISFSGFSRSLLAPKFLLLKTEVNR